MTEWAISVLDTKNKTTKLTSSRVVFRYFHFWENFVTKLILSDQKFQPSQSHI